MACTANSRLKVVKVLDSALPGRSLEPDGGGVLTSSTCLTTSPCKAGGSGIWGSASANDHESEFMLLGGIISQSVGGTSGGTYLYCDCCYCYRRSLGLSRSLSRSTDEHEVTMQHDQHFRGTADAWNYHMHNNYLYTGSSCTS